MLLDGVTSASSHLAACDLFPTLYQLCVLGQGLGVTGWALAMGHAWMRGTWGSGNREAPPAPTGRRGKNRPQSLPSPPYREEFRLLWFLSCVPQVGHST